MKNTRERIGQLYGIAMSSFGTKLRIDLFTGETYLAKPNFETIGLNNENDTAPFIFKDVNKGRIETDLFLIRDIILLPPNLREMTDKLKAELMQKESELKSQGCGGYTLASLKNRYDDISTFEFNALMNPNEETLKFPEGYYKKMSAEIAAEKLLDKKPEDEGGFGE
jgi:hypothetical protein